MNPLEDPSRFRVTVSTGSRLHFGLTRVRPVAAGSEGRFGGVGVMIEQPGTVVQVSAARGLVVEGSSRIETFARNWATANGKPGPDCRIRVAAAPPSHSGFGSGTQMAQAIARALNRFHDMPPPTVQQVALQLDRGHRSMIGSYGFASGGLIVDGALPAGNGHDVAALARRVAVPESWHAVLVLHHAANRKFGVQEKSAFDTMVATGPDRSRRLEDLIETRLVPAAETADFEPFCDAVHEYGKLSGEFYSGVQGGIYNGPVLASVVATLHREGARGVGQSSWGPVIFCWCEDERSASEMRNRLHARLGAAADVRISRVRNQPASVRKTLQPAEPVNPP